ncbi:MAG: PIG-L family deacetylase [Acetobacteraceae bacterium]
MTGAETHRIWRALPLSGLADVTTGSPLVLAPHPDDESLGCGGLIAASVAAGLTPFVVILTDGTGSHPHSRRYPPAALRDLRETETRAAAAALGLTPDRLVFLRLRDTAAPSAGPAFERAAERVAELAVRHGCATICTTWRHDPHGDHEAAHVIGVAAAVRAGAQVRAYPVWGWTLADDALLPDTDTSGVRLDITRFLPAKRAAIAAHASQHGRVIDDDVNGFTLPPALLALFDQPFEVFLP